MDFFMRRVVLLVDDEVSFLKSMQRFFATKDSFSLLVAESGLEALEILKNNHVDVVIADCKMPGMDGITLLKKIRMEYGHTILMMVTAIQDINTAVQAINEIGIYKFILKPIDPDALFKILDDIHAFFDASKDEKLDFHEELKKRDAILRAFEHEYPGISKLNCGKIKFIVD